ncbi:lysosomal Pro-X carboxypeptidase-like [Punica granatum]|uniref:Lysosomal Pro-X carboxypeptidase-like n=1 Tax=Punica granatum TaxID=22663 RepID=A0A218Y137_PUNGR|nr:lysosomal Pro-X carboxypeptidase-like [Punica granatum]OWM90934.1 hypothetical protein CDL15_Pgr019246 [Punica granatum]
MSSTYCHFPLLLSLLLLSAAVSAAPHLNRIPKLSLLREISFLQDSRSTVTESVINDENCLAERNSENCISFFNQTLDHFNYRPESYTTFKHKYVINFKYWGGANSSAPIFAYLGAEGPLAQDIPVVGFLTDNAPQFKALILYIEHRFYGDSIPYNLSLAEALNNTDTRGYFNSAQALADYATVITHVKRKLGVHKSPVIVVGGSYGGMLASWFRLKYPHIALGALASSAPILLPVNFTLRYGYYTIVSNVFQEISQTCYETINISWSQIDQLASTSHGLQNLSETFKTCRPLKCASELKNYLINMYIDLAQYNNPFKNQVAKLCDVMNSNPSLPTLEKIFAGVVATYGNVKCYVNATSNDPSGWSWQICSDIMMPLACNNETMFQPYEWTLRSHKNDCKSLYGVAPRPHWISTYYGGQDIKLILQRFGSNIIFSNGLKDPFSSGGVLTNISDTIVAVYTAEGSHCLDLHPKSTNVSDPDPYWLVKQRETEVEIMEKWISTYYDDLKKLQDN